MVRRPPVAQDAIYLPLIYVVPSLYVLAGLEHKGLHVIVQDVIIIWVHNLAIKVITDG